MKAKLSLMTEAELKDKSSLLSKNLEQLFCELHVIQKKMILGAFAPMPFEALWFSELSVDCQKLTAYPFIDSKMKVMSFKKAMLNELVVRRDFGVEILGPKEEALECLPEIVIVPGLVFSIQGERLGRGRGFYDHYLAQFGGIKIGIGFSTQIEKDLPTEEHDVKLDYLVTEEKIIKCK